MTVSGPWRAGISGRHRGDCGSGECRSNQHGRGSVLANHRREGMYASKSLNAASAGLSQAVDGSGNTQRNGSVKSRQISLRLRGKYDALDQEGSR